MHADGIDYTSCCPNTPTRSFWFQYSVEFAQAASGTVFFLTDGESSVGAFNTESFFATAELPNLSTDTVTHVIVLLVHRRGRGK